MLDFEVDPSDPQRIAASSEAELLRSRDGGATWRSLGHAAGARLAWPARDALYRALKDGGDTWQAGGSVDGEPYRFKWVGRGELSLVLGDATIMHTTDGARTWKAAFRP